MIITLTLTASHQLQVRQRYAENRGAIPSMRRHQWFLILITIITRLPQCSRDPTILIYPSRGVEGVIITELGIVKSSRSVQWLQIITSFPQFEVHVRFYAHIFRWCLSVIVRMTFYADRCHVGLLWETFIRRVTFNIHFQKIYRKSKYKFITRGSSNSLLRSTHWKNGSLR